jgi:hypothetical protein
MVVAVVTMLFAAACASAHPGARQTPSPAQPNTFTTRFDTALVPSPSTAPGVRTNPTGATLYLPYLRTLGMSISDDQALRFADQVCAAEASGLTMMDIVKHVIPTLTTDPSMQLGYAKLIGAAEAAFCL